MLLSLLMAAGASVRARAVRDVAYGSGPARRLDLYVPAGADGEAPVVVFAHSGWPTLASRRRFAAVGQILASRGFVTAVPDFHVFPNCRYPEFLQDVAAACAWAKRQAGDHGGDPRRLFLVGHSGGAYVGAMLALDPRWLDAVGLSPDDLRGMVGVSGLYDFLPWRDPAVNAVFGPEADWPASQPVNHARPSAPPMLLVAGDRDRVDPERNTGGLARALRTVGGAVTEIRYPDLGDSMGLHSLTGSLRFRATVLKEVERFIRLRSLDLAA